MRRSSLCGPPLICVIIKFLWEDPIFVIKFLPESSSLHQKSTFTTRREHLHKSREITIRRVHLCKSIGIKYMRYLIFLWNIHEQKTIKHTLSDIDNTNIWSNSNHTSLRSYGQAIEIRERQTIWANKHGNTVPWRNKQTSGICEFWCIENRSQSSTTNPKKQIMT